MRRRKTGNQAKTPTRRRIFIIAPILAIAATATLIRMYTLDTEIKLVQTFQLSEFPTISPLESGDYRELAISVDGKILQKTGQETPQPTASTAKMILGLAVMEKKPFSSGEQGETITITPEFYQKYLWYTQNNGSTVPVITGEEINQYDALAAVFLASANNLADSLAIWVFGSLEEYQSYATEMLAKIGVRNTTIGTDASGYSATTTSTAEDLSIIAAKLLENPVLREIVGLKTHTVPVAGLITNTNQILGTCLKNNVCIGGVKTGYIGDASGYNLVSSYEMDGHFVTAALLGASTRQASFTESENTLRRLSSELTPTTLVAKNTPVGYLETWWSGRHELTAVTEVKALVARDEDNPPSVSLSESELTITVDQENYTTSVSHEDFASTPTFIERFLHLFGWQGE